VKTVPFEPLKFSQMSPAVVLYQKPILDSVFMQHEKREHN